MGTTLRCLSEALLSLKSERHVVLRGVGLEEATLRHEPQRVTAEQEAALWQALAHQCGDGGIALTWGQASDPLRLGALGPLLASATTLGEALSELCELSGLVFWRRFVWIEGGAGALLRLGMPKGVAVESERAAAEFALAALAGLVDRLAGRRVAPTHVHLAHEAAPHADAYAAVFACPVRFGAAHTELCYAGSLADQPGPSPDPRLHALLRAHAREHLADSHASASTAERVRRALQEMSDLGDASVGAVADALHVAQRTLHRRLRLEGSSYQEILDAVRMQRCVQHMQLRTRLTKEIAYALGFSDPSNLYRAFRRWTGLTVSEYRAQQRRQALAASAHDARVTRAS
jgi:AraC-like DNA-binding protein